MSYTPDERLREDLSTPRRIYRLARWYAPSVLITSGIISFFAGYAESCHRDQKTPRTVEEQDKQLIEEPNVRNGNALSGLVLYGLISIAAGLFVSVGRGHITASQYKNPRDYYVNFHEADEKKYGRE
jgi:hypothetical protein